MAMNTGTFPKLLKEGLNSIFGLAYNERADEWMPIFDTEQSTHNYEEDVMITTMGLAPVKAEGSPVSYDDLKQNYIARHTNVAYALGFIVTHEEVKDNLYLNTSIMKAKGLARSMKQTKNYNGANILNRAFSSSYTGGDGVSLLNTSHPTESGVQSNKLTVAADLSEASIEDLLIQLYDARDNRNKKMALMEECLVIPSELQFEAERIIKNPERPGTADRDINAMYAMGKFPKGIVINHFLTDSDAWFIKSDCPNGMVHFQREPLVFSQDNEFDTDNLKFKAYERYVFGWKDWRSLWGSEGA